MFRQRLLSTDVLPHDSSYSSNASPTMAHHPRYNNNVAHASVQTSDTMTTNSRSSSEQPPPPQEKHPWLPIPINENTSRL
ncbi:unnamed protein product, partial [Rotaria sp. Silwood2]